MIILVLILTYWNVNNYDDRFVCNFYCVLILTYWNVN